MCGIRASDGRASDLFGPEAAPALRKARSILTGAPDPEALRQLMAQCYTGLLSNAVGETSGGWAASVKVIGGAGGGGAATSGFSVGANTVLKTPELVRGALGAIKSHRLLGVEVVIGLWGLVLLPAATFDVLVSNRLWGGASPNMERCELQLPRGQQECSLWARFVAEPPAAKTGDASHIPMLLGSVTGMVCAHQWSHGATEEARHAKLDHVQLLLPSPSPALPPTDTSRWLDAIIAGTEVSRFQAGAVAAAEILGGLGAPAPQELSTARDDAAYFIARAADDMQEKALSPAELGQQLTLKSILLLRQSFQTIGAPLLCWVEQCTNFCCNLILDLLKSDASSARSALRPPGAAPFAGAIQGNQSKNEAVPAIAAKKTQGVQTALNKIVKNSTQFVDETLPKQAQGLQQERMRKDTSGAERAMIRVGLAVVASRDVAGALGVLWGRGDDNDAAIAAPAQIGVAIAAQITSVVGAELACNPFDKINEQTMAKRAGAALNMEASRSLADVGPAEGLGDALGDTGPAPVIVPDVTALDTTSVAAPAGAAAPTSDVAVVNVVDTSRVRKPTQVYSPPVGGQSGAKPKAKKHPGRVGKVISDDEEPDHYAVGVLHPEL